MKNLSHNIYLFLSFFRVWETWHSDSEKFHVVAIKKFMLLFKREFSRIFLIVDKKNSVPVSPDVYRMLNRIVLRGLTLRLAVCVLIASRVDLATRINSAHTSLV